MTTAAAARADVVVVGAGVIGLAVAWQVAATGAQVVVCDPAPGSGASWAAAGMLAPVTEARGGEPALTALRMASAARWSEFAARLEAASGREVGLRTEGTLVAAVDDDDRRALDELAAVHAGLGLAGQRLTGGAARALEPLLQPRLRAGLLVPGDHQVDPRAVLGALLVAGESLGVEVRTAAVEAIRGEGQGVSGVTLGDGTVLDAPVVVVAAGARSGGIEVPGPGGPAPLRPVKGQILRLRFDPADPPLSHTVRALVHGWSVYLVPRAGGELVIGATMEEQGFDIRVTAGAVADLLGAAIEVVPDVGELELVECTARSRPATPDDGPVLGAGPRPGVIYATGHHRNGVLLAPVTVDAVLAALAGVPLPDVARPFGAERFG